VIAPRASSEHHRGRCQSNMNPYSEQRSNDIASCEAQGMRRASDCQSFRGRGSHESRRRSRRGILKGGGVGASVPGLSGIPVLEAEALPKDAFAAGKQAEIRSALTKPKDQDNGAADIDRARRTPRSASNRCHRPAPQWLRRDLLRGWPDAQSCSR
jgi:hypothetical protein